MDQCFLIKQARSSSTEETGYLVKISVSISIAPGKEPVAVSPIASNIVFGATSKSVFNFRSGPILTANYATSCQKTVRIFHDFCPVVQNFCPISFLVLFFLVFFLLFFLSSI